MALDPDAVALVQVFPVPGAHYTDTFGAPRPGGRTHQGDDLFAPLGALVVAAHWGRVTNYIDGLGGKAVHLQHPRGHTYYAHLERWARPDRSMVKAGDLIGYVDHTGDAVHTSDHCHFELHPRDQAAIDPTPYLNRVRTASGGVSVGPGLPPGPLPVIPAPQRFVKGESAAAVIKGAARGARRAASGMGPSVRRIRTVYSNWR